MWDFDNHTCTEFLDYIDVMQISAWLQSVSQPANYYIIKQSHYTVHTQIIYITVAIANG